MLGFHSPVIKEKYIKAGILEIDADEFSLGSVTMFVEAMYSGQLDLTRASFREVNKLSHVFQVTWLLSKCRDYFGSAFDAEDSKDVEFAFEEAMYFSEHGRSGSLLEIWKDKVREDRRVVLIEEYLSTHPNLCEFTLKYLVDITRDHAVFVTHIRGSISETNTVLDRVSKFLLMSVNLVGCIETGSGDIICEIFDILLENTESADWKMLKTKYKTLMNEFFKEFNKHKSGKSVAAKSIQSYQHFPNLVTLSFGLDVKGLKTIEKVAAVSCNLYMVLEFINVEDIDVTASLIHKLHGLVSERGWRPVHSQFLESLYWMSDEEKDMLRETTIGITADAHSVRVISEDIPSDFSFLTNSAMYRFEMAQPHCNEVSKCGFLVEVTGVSSETPLQFDMKLVLDEDTYPEDLHCHSLSTDDMHIVWETFSDGHEDKSGWGQIDTSWAGRPFYRSDGVIQWGVWDFSELDKEPARLVVYYSGRASN